MSFHRRPFRTSVSKGQIFIHLDIFSNCGKQKFREGLFWLPEPAAKSERCTQRLAKALQSASRNVILYNVTFLFIQSSLPISVTIIIKTVPTQRPRIYFEKDSLRRRAASLMFSRLPNALQRT